MSYGGRQPDLISKPHDDLYSFVINKRVQFIIVQKKLKKGGGETDRNFPLISHTIQYRAPKF